ncbi:MAG: hypothetical protein V4603_19130 [Pseudomonadota bacterium]
MIVLSAALLPVVAQPANEAPPVAPPTLPVALLPAVSINELMSDTINPSARALWRAVSYTVTAEGVTETMPETDEDWQQLRAHGDALVKAGATLLLPALTVSAAPTEERPDFQFTPAEIAQLMQQNKVAWTDNVRNMQTATLQILATIEKRDMQAYIEAGPALNATCESCHAQFWYKPQDMR